MPACRRCKTAFTISPEETKLRESICRTFATGPVPPPTRCPDCRMQKLMARRNERQLYRRTCDLTKQPIIAVYPAGTPFPVYERTAWWSDAWDATQYGRPFDFSRPFFEQFHELQQVVPRASLNATNVVGSDYANFCLNSKNCYLSHNTYSCEDLLYCYWLYESKNCIDSSYCFQSEQCVDCTDCNHSYNCRSCQLAHTCSDSAFLYDCRSCAYCFGCVGIRHKQYCFFNEQLTKEEYEKRIAALDLEDPTTLADIQKKLERLKQNHPRRDSIQDKTQDCTGDYIFESKNCHDCFQVYNSEDCMHVQEADVKRCLDGYHPGWSEGLYEVYSSVNQQQAAFSSQCWEGHDTFYCDTCIGCTHCFGCIGLRHKSYCMLNKQYAKKEYETLLEKIVAHMKQTGEWGEFFPIERSPFCYNETNAYEYYPLTKEQARAEGFRWRDPDPKEYQPQTYRLPVHSNDATDDITSATFACEQCSKNYRIITQELAVYRAKKIPIPRRCPDCRHRARLATRNPRKLYQRACQKCQAPISTTYAPDRPEIVYCEACYLKAVY